MKTKVLDRLPPMPDPRLDVAVHIALSTALRRSEILRLRVEELLAEDGQILKTVKVRRKGGKTQSIYLPDKLREKIAGFIGDRKTGWLLESTLRPGQQLSPTTLWLMWHQAQSKAGIPD